MLPVIVALLVAPFLTAAAHDYLWRRERRTGEAFPALRRLAFGATVALAVPCGVALAIAFAAA